MFRRFMDAVVYAARFAPEDALVLVKPYEGDREEREQQFNIYSKDAPWPHDRDAWAHAATTENTARFMQVTVVHPDGVHEFVGAVIDYGDHFFVGYAA